MVVHDTKQLYHDGTTVKTIWNLIWASTTHSPGAFLKFSKDGNAYLLQPFEWESFQSDNLPGHYWQVSGSMSGSMSVIDPQSTQVDQAKFKRVNCTNGDAENTCSNQGLKCVSIESVEHPESFFRHKNYKIMLSAFDSNVESEEAFNDSASFCAHPGNADSNGVSFSSAMSQFKNHFIRHMNLELYLHEKDDSPLFNQDSTFHPNANDVSFADTLPRNNDQIVWESTAWTRGRGFYMVLGDDGKHGWYANNCERLIQPSL